MKILFVAVSALVLSSAPSYAQSTQQQQTVPQKQRGSGAGQALQSLLDLAGVTAGACVGVDTGVAIVNRRGDRITLIPNGRLSKQVGTTRRRCR